MKLRKTRKTQWVMPYRLMAGLLATLLWLSSCAREEDMLPDASLASPEQTLNAVPEPQVTSAPVLETEQAEAAPAYFPRNASATARTAATTDYVDFDDPASLMILPDQAANTFAYAPFYIQAVGNAWFHVKENNGTNYKAAFRSNYGHYHLSYQNFDPCIRTNGQFGKPSGNSCLAINPAQEPRTLNTHYGDEWIKIYAYDYTNPSRVFDLISIKVTDGPITLWFKQSGKWRHWNSLGTGTWNTSTHTKGITEVLISGIDNSSIGIDNIRVRVP